MLKNWIGWCSRAQIYPFCYDINQVLDFLGKLFQGECEFKNIACHWVSAVSAYYSPINGSKVEVQQRVYELMKGFFNNGPPTQKCILT